MVAEIAQQLGEHNKFLHVWPRADHTTLGETMVPTNRGGKPKGGGIRAGQGEDVVLGNIRRHNYLIDRFVVRKLERETGFEPATDGLGRLKS